MGMGFMVKLCYVLGTSISERQHDVSWFEPSKEVTPGHLGYISYLCYNHHLYDGDYRQVFQYCHPPKEVKPKKATNNIKSRYLYQAVCNRL